MAGYLIRRTHQISTAIFTEECAAFDLTAVQYAALAAIGRQPHIDATRMSQTTSLDRSTLGDVLERIEAKGLVRRTSSPTDRRVKLLSLSAEGKKLLVDVDASVERVQDRLLKPLSANEQKKLIALLTKLTGEHENVLPAKA